jgi:S-DNA-T family DNA segregation ATPase FtsK/SpoIIIE
MATTSRQPRRGNGELEPILASWLTDRDERRDVVVGGTVYVGHTALRHVVWTPVYAMRAVRYAPWGLWHLLKIFWIWLLDLKTKELIDDTHEKREHARYQSLTQQRRATVQDRLLKTFVGYPTILVFALSIWIILTTTDVIPAPTHWQEWLLSIGVVCALGVIGYREAKRVRPDLLTDDAGDLTGTVVIDALCSLGIPGMREPEDIRLLYAVKPSRNIGYDIDLELPKGVSSTDVMSRRDRLSSALRRPVGTVWPSVGPRHEGHLKLFISHEDMGQARQARWPLLTHGVVDVFEPQPMFTDQRGDWVHVRLATKSGITGAIPRMGKTFLWRQVGLVAGLDPRSELYGFDLKGTGDLSPLKLICHYYSDDDEEDAVTEHLSVLEKLQVDRRRRSNVLKSLSNEESSRSEVTTELAARRDLRLHPVFVLVDECQVWFEHPDKKTREAFIAIVTDLVKRGPAVGIHVYLATQKPDTRSIPSHISSNVTFRVCFKVENQIANDQVLGTGAHRGGAMATMFDFDKDKGVAYLKDGGVAQIVRTVHGLDKIESEKVAVRARAERQRLGLLTGMAAGDDGVDRDVEQIILLDDARRVMGDADAMHLSALANGLVELRPVEYKGLTSGKLGTELRNAGVKGIFKTTRVNGAPGKAVRCEQLNVSATDVTGDDEDPEAVTDAVTGVTEADDD